MPRRSVNGITVQTPFGDDFDRQDQLTRTLSRDRAKDMASDYEQSDPVQGYAERRGVTFRARVAEIVRKIAPERLRAMFDGLRLPASAASDPEGGQRREGKSAGTEARHAAAAPARETAEDREEALRQARTKALIRHARAVDATLAIGGAGGSGNPEQMSALTDARKAFEEVRPHGWRDAEAAYVKNPDLVRETAGGRVNRAIRALQLETEIRTDPARRADRFVERWRRLGQASQRQYRAGDMSSYKTTE